MFKVFLTRFIFIIGTFHSYSGHSNTINSAVQCNIENIIEQQNRYLSISNNTTLKKFEYKKNNKTFIQEVNFNIVNKTPHDINAYTQGLTYQEGYLYESTGILGLSDIRKTELISGDIIHYKKLPNQYFAEGLTLLKNQLIQFTLKKNKVFIYDLDDLNLINEINFKDEVWGATNFESNILVSNGTEFLNLLDPSDFTSIKKSTVLIDKTPLQGINELEFINKMLYANVWPTDCIAIIEPDNFQVVAWINLSKLFNTEVRPHSSAVLNGIAHQPDKDLLLVTGKNWPFVYHIKLNIFPFEVQNQ